MLRLRQLLPKATNQPPAQVDTEGLPLPVLEFQSPTAAVLAAPVPRIANSTNYIITGLVFCLLVVAAVMKTDMIVTGNGVLVSTAPDFNIQTFNASSIVQDIKVHPGEIVTKGQVLATLDPTDTSADFDSLTQQEQGYAAQVAQLQAQEDGKPYFGDPNNPQAALQLQTYNQQVAQYNFTLQDYAQKIANLQTQITGYDEQATYFRQRLGIATSVEGMRQTLQHLQVGSLLDTLAATDDRVNIQAQLSDAVSSATAAQKQLAAEEAERDTFIQQWKANISQELLTANNNLAQAEQQLAHAKLANQLVELTAPDDAIVNTVAPVAAGSVLQAGSTMFDLSPINAPFQVEADIDGSESGYVHVGDPVNIKLSTLSYLQYGIATGTVTSISAESFNPLDQQAASTNGPQLPGAPQDLYYKATISLDLMDFHDVPAGFKLVPGMPLEADMKVGSSTILSFFLRKIMPIAYDSMHEP